LLLQQPLEESAEELMREVVRAGSKGEAVAATRALCGFRMTNLAHVPESERQQVVASCEPVDLSWFSGRGYAQAALYWVPTHSDR
jgi:hypothetical protein